MFKLKRPCKTCPFLKSQGRNFRLCKERIEEIVDAQAFQCHKTVDYSEDAPHHQGEKPQQCAGLIAMLHKSGRKANPITQVASRLIGFDPASIDGSNVYDTVEEAIRDHAS